MRIVLIGAPGSGKTWIAKFLSNHLNLTHIESDKIFWQGKDLRSEIKELIRDKHWVLDGHISKLSDLVLPKADKILVVEGLNLLNLIRSVKRDWKNPPKAWFNIQHYGRLTLKRNELINELLKSRPEDVFFLDNFPNLNESKLTAFCEGFKSSSLKTKKPAVKRQRS